MASTTNTIIVKLKIPLMVVYLSKPMIMRINHVGISRMRRYRMVDMCKGKRKYDYEAPMTSSLSDCTWLEKE
jgi:hypothetical protein